MHIGIFAKTFDRRNPEEHLIAVRESGLTVAHYNMTCSGLSAMPDVIRPGQAEEVREAAARQGIDLVGLSGTFNMIHPDKAHRRAGFRKLRVLVASARSMGIPLITLCTGTRDAEDKWREHPGNNLPAAWSDLCTSMEEALTIADEHGIMLGVEPELANVVNSTRKARTLLDEMKSPRLRIVFDPANLFEIAPADEQRRLIDEGLDLLSGDLIMAHAKDRTSDGGFCAAGKGIIDFAYYVQALQKAGFDGPLVLHGLEEEDVKGSVAMLRRCL